MTSVEVSSDAAVSDTALTQTTSLEFGELRAPNFIVGIGASAGGLEALERLFQNIPEDTGMAFVVVQHLSPDFKSVMDELLARWTSMPIQATTDRMPVAANQIYLMPPKTEMIISNGCLLLTPREHTDELHLPIDQFFRSLARDAGPKAIAIVLSGTGSDGSRGIRDIHDASGFVLVQSEESAKFDGMPKSAIQTGIVDAVCTPEEIAATLVQHVKHIQPVDSLEVDDNENDMASVFKLLRAAYGIDFSHYKPATVQRRTAHRMQLCRLASAKEYLERLRLDRDELDALYHDLLIGVTSFFRDTEAFQALEQELPALLDQVPPGEEFRAWVAGCATGEEAYSVAILISEQIKASGKPINVKIFATDVHKRSLERAAQGIYNEAAIAKVSPERLKSYFIKTNDGYRVSPELRGMVVFAAHNVIRDAPFTRLDLLTCRNLLIYLVPVAQRKALCLFHFGLKKDGLLFLGPSETPGDLSSEFDIVHQHWKLFRKRRDARLPSGMHLPLSLSTPNYPTTGQGATRYPENQLNEVFGVLLDRTLPPSVLVNEQLDIVHTFGNTSPYLRLQKGLPSLKLPDMVTEELRTAVVSAAYRAMRENQLVSFTGVHKAANGEKVAVHICVLPVAATRRFQKHALLRFEEASSQGPAIPGGIRLEATEAANHHIETLESELRFTKETLQATIQELETSNEELQATNEELLAANEELQSTNEELHSVNEELFTVNAEYQRKIQQLTELTGDMDNLLYSTDVHTLFLDQNLCIRKFTPKVAEVFNLIASDLGRKIHGFVHTIQCDKLLEKLAGVSADGSMYEEEVRNLKGDWFLMRILPYRGSVGHAGVVLTLVDINRVKEAEERFRNAVEVSPNGMLIINQEGKITLVNSEVERMFGYNQAELLGKSMEVLLPEEVRQFHREVREKYFEQPSIIRRMGNLPNVWGRRKNGQQLPLDVRVNPIKTLTGVQAIASLVDISHHHRLQTSLGDQVKQRDRFLAVLSHELRNPMGAILTASSLLERVAAQTSDVIQPCQVIRRQASQMAGLLEDLLDISRIAAGKVKLQKSPNDLVEVCRQSIEAVTPLVDAHRHKVQLNLSSEPVWVNVDRRRMQQVVENLLTNAIKYTPNGGRIEVALLSENEQAVIRVRDNGCGMSPELLATIFDMFVQSDDTLDRSDGGMGVGLTIVRAMVELHQGSIEARSEGPGMGSEFLVRLPLTKNRPPDAVAEPHALPPQKIRVALVDDNEDFREMLGALLEIHGFQVVGTAQDGNEGYNVVVKHRPNVAVLDIGLPGMDGYQLARKLRKTMGNSLRLIALTGYGRDEDHKAVMKAGFDEHLVKPVNTDVLINAVSQTPAV